ncbi:MAG: hypothetical protein J6Y02_19850 [Pseudobutyrivibrio sp.]|nr:hypothetical protein [Pseudobutyrivibrio sp.]
MSYTTMGLRESYDVINEIQTARDEKIRAKQEQRLNEANDARYDRDMIIESREIYKDAIKGYREAVTTKILGDVLKSIYITALESSTMMTEGDYNLANKLVDTYISENGTFAILRRMSGKTYLLDTLKTIVEDTAEDAEENSDEEEKSTEEVPEKSKEDMYEKLENEDDVNDAVNVISQRIAAAEEEFIKKNAEDKKKIEDIVNDINDRIQAVKDDVSKDDETKKDVEESYTIEKTRKINEIYDNRTHTLFDRMVHDTAKNIYKDAQLKESYSDEGRLDIQRVVNSTKCMYGFLEFVNTIQLDKIDKKYIEKVIAEM